MSAIFSLLIPIANLFLLFKIWREIKIVSEEAQRKFELNETIKKFGKMFADASGEIAPAGKKRVSFEARED